MFTKAFLSDAAERAVKTIAQTALSLVTIQGFDLLHVDWEAFLSVVILAGVISLLTSIVSLNVGSKDSASLVK